MTSSSIPTSETRTYRSMTRPLSRIRSMTSANPLGFGARVTPPPPLVVRAVVLIRLSPRGRLRRSPSVAGCRQLLLDDDLARDLPDDARPFDELLFDEPL